MNISRYIADNYGSKKGFLRFWKAKIFDKLAGQKTASLPQGGPFKRLVFICSGNICRSAFGKAVSERNGMPAISFGLHCRGGDAAFDRTLDYANKTGFDLQTHITTHISNYQYQEGDLLVVMEPNHKQELERVKPGLPFIFLGNFSSQKSSYIHDPYCTNDFYFERNLSTIEEATKRLIRSIEDDNNERKQR